jgi:hypothetical protein
MTMSLHKDATDDMVKWRLAEEGFWVGARAGCFAGTIDQNGSHYYARTQFGEYIGDYSDLRRAKAALESRLSEPALGMAV